MLPLLIIIICNFCQISSNVGNTSTSEFSWGLIAKSVKGNIFHAVNCIIASRNSLYILSLFGQTKYQTKTVQYLIFTFVPVSRGTSIVVFEVSMDSVCWNSSLVLYTHTHTTYIHTTYIHTHQTHHIHTQHTQITYTHTTYTHTPHTHTTYTYTTYTHHTYTTHRHTPTLLCKNYYY